MNSMLGFKIFGALLFLCLLAKSVSGAPFPGGTELPTGDFSPGLTLSANKDGFDTGTSPSSSWTNSATTNTVTQGFKVTAAAGSTSGYLTAIVNDNEVTPAGTALTLTWATAASVGYGVRVAVSFKTIVGSGTTASSSPSAFVGWAEASSTTNPKYYLASYNVKDAAATTQKSYVGYYDPSLTPATSRYVKQTPSAYDSTVSGGLIGMVDVRPSNISWGTFDSANANQKTCGLYRNCFASGVNSVTTVTPAATGSMIIGGVSTAAGSATTNDAISYQIDWIAQYNYAAPSSSTINKASLSLFSLMMGAILFILYQKQ